MHGIIIGRFMPPHRGHLYLADFAATLVDRLTVLVCSLSWEPIAGDLRFAWMQDLCPHSRVVHITEEIPAARRDQPGAIAIWADAVRRYVHEPVDVVFASEPYGWELAEQLGARFVEVDPARESIPVSASVIRENPYAYWRYLPPPVRAYYARHVAVTGVDAEYYAVALARRLQTVVVRPPRAPERTTDGGDGEDGGDDGRNDRSWEYRTELTVDHPFGARAIHAALVAALARASNRFVIHALPEDADRALLPHTVRFEHTFPVDRQAIDETTTWVESIVDTLERALPSADVPVDRGAGFERGPE